MDNGRKTTLKVLTTNDIRKHARDWTLAGDAGLLAHLEQFSENIISKTQETQKNFNELVDNYEELYAKVSNITNQFLALQNCQFVENRVYDEETPTEEQSEVKVHNEEEQENLLLMQYKETIEIGIKLLDTHFQEVPLPPNSDSDDEDEVSIGNSVIWKPKNPYASKKFPFLIGSAEWWGDDHVGLKLNEEISDSEKIILEPESDRESLKSVGKAIKSSSSSMENIKPITTEPIFMEFSEDLFGLDKNEAIKNSTVDDNFKESNSLLKKPTNFLTDFEPETGMKKKSDFFNENTLRNEEKREEVAPSKPKKVDNEFTTELMAKLASVTNKIEKLDKKEEEEEKSEENLLPVEIKTDESLFDEIDDSGDLFSTKISRIPEKVDGMKSLFIDVENDDELFEGENDLLSGENLFQSDIFRKPETIADFEPRREPKKLEREGFAPKKIMNNLFDDLENDHTLFAAKSVNDRQAEKSLPSVENGKKTKPIAIARLAWDNEEGLFDSTSTEFDDDFFNSSGLFDTKVDKVEEKKKTFPKPENKTGTFKTTPEWTTTKKASTKDSFEDPFGYSISKSTTHDKISILDSEEGDDLCSESFTEEKKTPLKVLTLPDDNDDTTALFGEKPKPPDSVSASSSRSNLFDDVSASKSLQVSVFDKDKRNKTENDSGNDFVFAGGAKSGKNLFSTKENSTLFDDICDDGDDMFGTGKKNEKSIFESSPVKKVKNNIFEDKKPQEAKSFTDNLFKASSTSTNLRVTKSDIFRQSDRNLFDDDLNDELFSDKTKPKPPNSLSLKAKEESNGQTKQVGKLNIPDNLKIRFESAAKHISSGAGKPLFDKENEASDDLMQSSALLKCPSKDRVKIPGRRRPQSRRARQEAIRNSGIWDQPLPPSGSSTIQPSKDSSPIVSNPLSPSTDEEDFFKVPELDTNFEKEDQSIFKSVLFESSEASKLDDNLLFDGAPVLSPHSPKKSGKPAEVPEKSLFGSSESKTASIFDEDYLNGEDDENLFRAPKAPTCDSGLLQILQNPTDPSEAEEKMKKPTSVVLKKIEAKTKKSLFDADDEDDDLFSRKFHLTPKPPSADKPKKGGEPKSKGNSDFVDPLGLITNDE